MTFKCAIPSFTFICATVCIHYANYKKRCLNMMFIHVKWPGVRCPRDVGEKTLESLCMMSCLNSIHRLPLVFSFTPAVRCRNVTEQLKSLEGLKAALCPTMKIHSSFSDPPLTSSLIPHLPGDGVEGSDDPRARVLLPDVPGLTSCRQAGGADGSRTSPLRHTHPRRHP